MMIEYFFCVLAISLMYLFIHLPCIYFCYVLSVSLDSGNIVVNKSKAILTLSEFSVCSKKYLVIWGKFVEHYDEMAYAQRVCYKRNYTGLWSQEKLSGKAVDELWWAEWPGFRESLNVWQRERVWPNLSNTFIQPTRSHLKKKLSYSFCLLC